MFTLDFRKICVSKSSLKKWLFLQQQELFSWKQKKLEDIVENFRTNVWTAFAKIEIFAKTKSHFRENG